MTTGEWPPVLSFREAVRARPGMFVGWKDARGIHALIDGLLFWAQGGRDDAWVEVTVTHDRGIRIHDDGVGPRDPADLTAALDDVPVFVAGSMPRSRVDLAADPEARWRGWDAAHLVVASELGDRFTIDAPPGDGVTVTFHPDPAVFTTAEIDVEALRMRMRELSYLTPSATWTLEDEATGNRDVFSAPGGTQALVTRLALETGIGYTVPSTPFRFQGASGSEERGRILVDVSMQWTATMRDSVYSYVDGQRTLDGGTHEDALRDAVDRSLASHGLTAPGSGLLAVVSVWLLDGDVRYGGATKDNLSDERGSLVGPVVEAGLRRVLSRDAPLSPAD